MARVTSKDVARAAGVSQTTVSFVLNRRGDQRISPETREHVLAVAGELGYVPSGAARSLRTGRSDVVLCVVPDLPVTQAMEEFKVELARALADGGCTCVYLQLAGVRHPLSTVWAQVHPAAVVSFGRLTRTDAHAIRVAGIALLDDVLTPQPDLLGLDQSGLGRIQVEHLADRGHRRIGYAAITDPRERPFLEPRMTGARDACSGLGLPDPVVAVVDVGAGARDALRAWRAAGVTAVAAFNDLTALTVLESARRDGTAVPGGLALVGVDDLQVGALMSPGLSTVAMDLTVPAETLAGHVLDALDRDLVRVPRPPRPAARLVPRGTT